MTVIFPEACYCDFADVNTNSLEFHHKCQNPTFSDFNARYFEKISKSDITHPKVGGFQK
jgi:hypothetical protein